MENKIYFVKDKKTNLFYGYRLQWVKDPKDARKYLSVEDALKSYGDGNRIYEDLVICEYELTYKKEYDTKREDFYFSKFDR